MAPLPARSLPFAFKTPPGHQTQADFGQTGLLIGGEPVRVFLCVLTSGFVMPFHHERRDNWLVGMQAAGRHLSVPETLTATIPEILAALKEARMRRVLSFDGQPKGGRVRQPIPVSLSQLTRECA